MVGNTRFFRIILPTLIGFLVVYTACKKSNSGPGTCSDGVKNQGETAIDCGGPCTACLSKRDSVIVDYQHNYIGSEITDPGWTGNVSTCDAGTVPQSTHDKVLQRLNYFRRMVGLNDNITLDATKFPEYQQTALMMKANSALSHSPPNSWTCYTDLGATGASTSNLSLGTQSTAAITAFINDNGPSNKPVGHRRWILHSTKMQFSYGATNSTMSLGVIGVANGNTSVPPFIAYPPAGFVPQDLVYARWSLSIPNADFSGATVSMTTSESAAVSLTIVSLTDNGYGDNTIVWEPNEIVNNSADDVTYKVTVSGITGAAQSSYSYTVTLIKP